MNTSLVDIIIELFDYIDSKRDLEFRFNSKPMADLDFFDMSLDLGVVYYFA